MDESTVDEVWKSIPGWEGLYEMSTLGRVKSLHRHTKAGPDGGIIKMRARNKSGHLQVDLHRDGQAWTFSVHRLVLLTFVGPCPEDMEVRHLNGNPADNRLENLTYGTSAENSRDCVEHGTHPNASKTHCPFGHEYSSDNTYSSMLPSGGTHRVCKTCHKEAVRRSKEKRLAEGQVCSVEGCGKLHLARGYCAMHYKHWSQGKL